MTLAQLFPLLVQTRVNLLYCKAATPCTENAACMEVYYESKVKFEPWTQILVFFAPIWVPQAEVKEGDRYLLNAEFLGVYWL